ncbi:MAG: DALR anticodon-binding domain-containing protein, partial [Bacteroidota bacterium]
ANTNTHQDLSLQPADRAVIIQLHKFPNKVQEAAEAYSPAIVAQYLFDLAKLYNRLYAELPIVHAKTSALKAMRVALSATVAKVLRQGMRLLGIEAPHQM